MASILHAVRSSAAAAFPTATDNPLKRIPLAEKFQPFVVERPALSAFIVGFISLLILEQTVYRSKKGDLPGDKWTIPLVGRFLNSMHPTLEKYRKQWDSGPLSCVSVFNIFVILASSNDYARKIFNSPQFAVPCIVDAAVKILEPDNWVFLNGKIHVEYRRVLQQLFTRKSLSIYLHTQDAIVRRHLAGWFDRFKTPKSIMEPVRHLNMDASLRTFCGNYIPEYAVLLISEEYWSITKAMELVNFPFAIPGTKVYRAIQARKRAMKFLQDAVRQSKESMAQGLPVHCLLDAWVRELMDLPEDSKIKREYTDREMALVVLSFLFASQDAMSSGVVYMFQHLADHPEILVKVREEQDRLRGGDIDMPTTLEMMDEMVYTKAFVKESLRRVPPVTMVPYRTTQAFPLTSTYTAPAGCMIVPSVWPSVQDPEVYPEPEKLIPERWLDPKSPANTNPKNYLVFGSGPHKCIGIEYATMHMTNVVGLAVTLMDWEHHRTETSDVTQIIATLFPKDGCIMNFKPRDRS
jgi:C-22 sterol desaturase